MELEYRESSTDISKITDEGIIEGYLTKWDTIDSYNSTFIKGAFERTIREKGASRIRLLWNHRDLAGKVLELVEDDIGVRVAAQFNMETRTGRESYAHVKHGDVDCFSFGFTSVYDGWVKEIRQIREIELFEVGPVIFEANSQAVITDVRTQEKDYFWSYINNGLKKTNK